MNPELLEKIQKEKMYDYLKENSSYIKSLRRNPNSYDEFKKQMKEKYHLRFSDKVSNIVDDIELVNSIISTLN